jgi:UDP-N-acetylmuramoyl-tripeptide--D-alanyl-D-alanine ligase
MSQLCRDVNVGGEGVGVAEAHSERGFVLTADAVAEAMNGRLDGGRADTPIAGVSIDSRTLVSGDLFIAIRGERLDGHAYVDAAMKAGAIGAVVAGSAAPTAAAGRPDAVLIRGDDTTRALQALARHVRRASGSQVVAITGSTGKTTTKEVAAAFLGLRYTVLRSSGNLNNHIGLPLSLLQLRDRPDVAVVELGMSHAGEIRTLVSVAEPDVRVWTNVAEVHSAFFASLDAIADAKAEILEGAGPASVLVANADDPLVMERAGRFAGAVRTFGTDSSAEVQASGIEVLGLDGAGATLRTPAGTRPLRTPLLGRGNLANVLAAAAVALHYEVPLDAIVERAAGLRPLPHRGEVLRLAGGVTLVDDSYNSNPRAVEIALQVVGREQRCARRVAVLGEMLELGTKADALHEACGRAAAAAGLAALVTVGGEPARALAAAAIRAGMPASAVSHTTTSEEAADRAMAVVRPGDLVLVKGSRGIRTEVVVERLMGEFG